MLTKLTRALGLSLGAWTLAAAPAHAASSVYFSNDAHELLCIAVGENPSSTIGTTVMIRGWSCINQGGTYTVPLDAGIRYVMIKDSSGRDYVARSPNRFRHDQGYAPSAPTTLFGLEIVARLQGDFTFRYFLDGAAWSASEAVSTFEDLDSTLLLRGFGKVNAWKFSASDYPGGIGIRLGEFG